MVRPLDLQSSPFDKLNNVHVSEGEDLLDLLPEVVRYNAEEKGEAHVRCDVGAVFLYHVHPIIQMLVEFTFVRALREREQFGAAGEGNKLARTLVLLEKSPP